MNFADYVEQFEWIQPVVFVCERCGEEYMLLKGGMADQEMHVPKMCAYCGADAMLGGIDKDRVN